MHGAHFPLRMLKRLRRMLQQLFRIARFCRRVTPLCSAEYFRAVRRAIRLCREKGFSPKEAFRLGLFDPNLSVAELSKCTSRKKMTEVQESLNPISWTLLAKDKSLFYRYCMALGIPVPELYAVFYRGTAGWSPSCLVLNSRDEWKRFFDVELPAEFVIKPAQGAFGRGVNLFSRAGKEFVDASARSYKAAELYDIMLSDSRYDGFVIQERLKNHPQLIHLSGTQSLQTVRITTFVDGNSQCRILHAFFKPIVGQNVIDNFEHGRTGNLQAEVSLDVGCLKPAVMMRPDAVGIETVPNHPKTGVSFNQFQLPLWHEACRLVKETALQFLPMRTIGWDVALTPEGPFILEANNWWQPLNIHRCMDTVLHMISSNTQSQSLRLTEPVVSPKRCSPSRLTSNTLHQLIEVLSEAPIVSG